MTSTPELRRDRYPFDLVAFDVDGTLVRGPRRQTIWELLNERFTGSADHNTERFALYNAGKLSYAEWVALDIGGWKDAGARRADLVAAIGSLSLVTGTRQTLETLRESGHRLVAISGTLDLLLETLLPDRPFDEVYCNRIGFDAEGRIAHWRATEFDMEGKARLLRAIALREEIPRDRCAFVGDSANDVWIAREAGFSIAFNPASPDLEAAADAVIRGDDLRAILPRLLPESAENPR